MITQAAVPAAPGVFCQRLRISIQQAPGAISADVWAVAPVFLVPGDRVAEQEAVQHDLAMPARIIFTSVDLVLVPAVQQNFHHLLLGHHRKRFEGSRVVAGRSSGGGGGGGGVATRFGSTAENRERLSDSTGTGSA